MTFGSMNILAQNGKIKLEVMDYEKVCDSCGFTVQMLGWKPVPLSDEYVVMQVKKRKQEFVSLGTIDYRKIEKHEILATQYWVEMAFRRRLTTEYEQCEQYVLNIVLDKNLHSEVIEVLGRMLIEHPPLLLNFFKDIADAKIVGNKFIINNEEIWILWENTDDESLFLYKVAEVLDYPKFIEFLRAVLKYTEED